MKSLRTRITAIATLVLTAVLAVAALLIVSLVDRQLRNDLQEQNNATLEQIAEQIRQGADPVELRLPAGSDGTEFLIETRDGFPINSTVLTIDEIQELDPGAFTDEQLAELERTGSLEVESDFDFFDGESIEVATPTGEQYVVRVLTTSTVIDRNVDQVRGVLWVVIPLLAFVFAVLIWLLTGRTLRPVDAITRKAARISTETLHERLDEPGTNDEIDRLARTLNSMLGRLDVGARRQQQFVSDASHELQSPLTVMLGESQLAATSGDPARLAEANALVIEHGQRMTKLIRDLLDLARTDAVELHRMDVDVDDVIREQARLNPAAIDTRAVQPARLHGDASSLGRLVRNLIDNAVAYSDGSVAVSCSLNNDIVEVHVDDDGPGIPPADREHVFERFSRVDESRHRSTGGTGLGLSIAKAICEGHGGTIQITDSPLGGARFTVRLPAA